MAKARDIQQLELFADERRQLVERWMDARDSTFLKFSYEYITTEFQRLPIYGKRIFYLLVLHAYHMMALEGQTIDKNFLVGDWADEDIELNIRDILASDKDTNYEQVKEYVKGVMTAVTEERNDRGDVRLSHFIQAADFEQKGRIIMRIDRRNWQRILDFAKGFKEGELEILMYTKGEYTPLAYLLFANQEKPILYSIATLRKIFLGENSTKYPKNNDFIRNVIDAPMKELNRYSPDSYRFWLAEDVKGGGSGRGRPQKSNYYFQGKHILENEPEAQRIRNLTPSLLLNLEVYNTLRNKYYFKGEHFSIHKELLARAERTLGVDGLLKFLGDNATAILRAEKPPLYVVGMLRRYLSNKETKENKARLVAAVQREIGEQLPTGRDLDSNTSTIGDMVKGGQDALKQLLG
ncbi:MAG: replication initiation protein [Bacteroidales bacterium]|nr:replication initiation protein [Bacteroidales bacterium]